MSYTMICTQVKYIQSLHVSRIFQLFCAFNVRKSVGREQTQLRYPACILFYIANLVKGITSNKHFRVSPKMTTRDVIKCSTYLVSTGCKQRYRLNLGAGQC